MPSTATLPWLTSAPPGPSRSPRRRRRFPVRRLRRVAAAALAGLAVVLTLVALRPRPPVTVTVAARDLPAGQVLGASDIRTVPATPDTVPEGADTAEIMGQRLARAVSARQIVTRTDLAPAHDLRPEERAIHVPVADPGSLTATRVGDRIDLVEAAGGKVVAAGVLVLAVDSPGETDTGHGLLVSVPATALTSLVPAMSANGPGVAPALRAP